MSAKKTDRFSGDCILLHGPAKIGKSTLAASFPKPILYLATETGYKYLPSALRQGLNGSELIPLEKKDGWIALRKEIEDLRKKNSYETVVLDTASMAYELCKRYFCRQHNISHPSERHDKGGLWSKIGDSFLEWMGYLAAACSGKCRLVLITHSREEEIETDTEKGVKKITVALTGQARQILLARPDHVWYMGYGGAGETGALKNFNQERCLWIQGSEMIYADTRDRGLSRKARCIDPLPEKGSYQAILDLYKRRRKSK